MNTSSSSRKPWFIFFALIILLLSACNPAALEPTQPSETPVVPVTEAPPQPDSEMPDGITLDFSTVAQDVIVETVEAQPASAGGPYWEAAPQYRRLTLVGYPVANHLLMPQIFIYPAGDLASANENAGKIAAELDAMLDTQQAGDHLPFLPLFNATQVMHAQVQYLDFQSGKGVRFLTQFDQAVLPINNYELIYTFQGLTSDGKYYLAAVLPVTHPELPAGADVSQQQADEMNDFPTYLSGMVTLLDQQPAGSFTPGLDEIDELVRSIDIR